jgi:hypothetical protein
VSALACIGEPVSWPRLETFAAGGHDGAIASHVAACPACQHCLDEIRGDLVALPPLAVPAPRAPRARAWWTRLVPAMALAAAALVMLIVWRGRAPDAPVREDVARVKGIGEVVLGVVRERGGVVREDVRSFAAGDRWKVVITCPPGGAASVEVVVTEAGATTSDHPLMPATLACGNRIVIPGAFTLTGTHAHRVCARVTSDGGDAGIACLTIAPEER